MLQLLRQNFDSEQFSNITWNTPEGGYFLTLTLPFEFGEHELHECAQSFKVIVTPLSSLSLIAAEKNKIRLAFSNCMPELLETALSRLAQYIKFKLGVIPEDKEEKLVKLRT